MNELENKYIKLLLEKCVNFENSKALFINYDKVNKDFINKLIIEAKKMGVTDIMVDENDIFLLHDKLKNMSVDEIEKDPYFDKNIWNTYALKGAAFIMISSEFPGVMDDIPNEKIATAKSINIKTRSIFREKEISYQIPWCIAALPNELWAKKLFPNSNNAYNDLFEVICKMCMVDTINPIESWNNYLVKTREYSEILNNLKIKKLHYTNSLGTDLTLTMPNNNVWISAANHVDDNMFVNMPSYEIFSTPDYRKTEGIVYSSRPLYYSGGLIDKFYIEFKNGKVTNFNAEKGYELLKQIIETDEHSCYLGEVALVENDSPISNTNLVFGTTLFDENASCHLALGDGFTKCVKNTEGLTKEQLLELGINSSANHVDFMIGTPDLQIEAETCKGKQLIFKKGDFCIKENI